MIWDSAKDLKKLTKKARKKAILNEKLGIMDELIEAAERGLSHWEVSVSDCYLTVDEATQWLSELGFNVTNAITARALVVSWNSKEEREQDI